MDLTDNPRTLGLHWSRGEIRTSHFIGVVRLGDEAGSPPFIVAPRIPNLDVAGIFAEVLTVPVEQTGVELSRLFGCDPDQAAIEGVQLPQLTLIEVIAFLSTLARFVQRHLRHGFVRVRENLTGKVRGRVLISHQIRENLVRARTDRMACEFTVFNLDTLENRILKAALDASARWLAQLPHNTVPERLHHWTAVARSSLAMVPEYSVNPCDWAAIRKTGLMAAYAQPLAYARLVLTRLHLTVTGAAEDEHKTLPFFLDANRLFEAWVGVCLSHTGRIPQAQGTWTRQIPGCGKKRFQPDFVLPEANGVPRAVVDAKYKPNGIDVTDLYQVIGYARLLAKPNILNDSQLVEGEVGYPEAWLAIPGDPDPDIHDINIAKNQFVEAWAIRQGTLWPDNFRLGCVRVPLPQINP